MESIGSRLKKARQEKNLTLEEIQKKTKIHPRVLKALEEDRPEQILGLTYIKGFLKTYADYLGLDGPSLVKEYVTLHPTTVREVIDLTKEKLPQTQNYVKVVSFFKKFALILPVLLIIFLFLLSLRSIIRSRELKKIEKVKSPKVTSKVKVAAPAVVKLELLKLAIRAKEDCWIQVKADGKIIFQNVLPKGSSEKWEAKEKLELWVGNSGVIDLELNDKPLGPLGRYGRVIKNILITKEGMKVGK
jgi:cytoskeletal protein RodZ